MRKNTFVAKKHIGDFNHQREKQGEKSFTRDELKQMLKSSKIPSNEVFVNALLRLPFIAKTGKTTYEFMVPDRPLYYGWLETAYKDYHKRVTTYHENYKKKKLLAVV